MGHSKGRTIIFWRGYGNPEKKNCLLKQKSPNKLFVDIKKYWLQEDDTGKKLFPQTRTQNFFFALENLGIEKPIRTLFKVVNGIPVLTVDCHTNT